MRLMKLSCYYVRFIMQAVEISFHNYVREIVWTHRFTLLE